MGRRARSRSRARSSRSCRAQRPRCPGCSSIKVFSPTRSALHFACTDCLRRRTSDRMKPCESVGRTARSPGAAPVLESTSPTPTEPAQLPVQERHWLRPAWLRNSLLPMLIGVVLLTPLSRSRVEVTPTGQPAAGLAQQAALAVPSRHRSLLRPSKTAAWLRRHRWFRPVHRHPYRSNLRGRPNGDPLRQRQRSSTMAAKRIAAPAGVGTQQRKVGAGPRRKQDQITHRQPRRWSWRSSPGERSTSTARKSELRPRSRDLKSRPGGAKSP